MIPLSDFKIIGFMPCTDFYYIYIVYVCISHIWIHSVLFSESLLYGVKYEILITMCGPRIIEYCMKLKHGLSLSSVLLWFYRSRAGTSNYIPQHLRDVITCPCPWYLLVTQRFWIVWWPNANKVILNDMITKIHLYLTATKYSITQTMCIYF